MEQLDVREMVDEADESIALQTPFLQQAMERRLRGLDGCQLLLNLTQLLGERGFLRGQKPKLALERAVRLSQWHEVRLEGLATELSCGGER